MRHIALCLVWDLESLEENKMTANEKVDVVNAFYEGKGRIVQVFNNATNRWEDVYFQIWDFEHNQYRIKPTKRTNKFDVGDTLVFKRVAGQPSPFRYEITEVTDDSYKFKHVSPSLIEEADENFINERDALWYFEIYDHNDKKYYMHSTRKTIPKMDEEFEAYRDKLSWEPMYNLGFKLKEN